MSLRQIAEKAQRVIDSVGDVLSRWVVPGPGVHGGRPVLVPARVPTAAEERRAVAERMRASRR